MSLSWKTVSLRAKRSNRLIGKWETRSGKWEEESLVPISLLPSRLSSQMIEIASSQAPRNDKMRNSCRRLKLENYKTKFNSSSAREFRELPLKSRKIISKKIDTFKENPEFLRIKKLEGFRNLYRIKAGNYRIMFEINHRDNYIKVIRIRHGRETYRK